MNTRILHLIFGLAVLGGLSACTRQLLEEPQARNTHRVHFAAGTAQTKTGITVEDGLMTPDWRRTDAANVHLFEIGNAGYSIATDVAIALSDNNKVAHFTADFPTEMTIIVDPSKKNSLLTASNESNAGPYTYAAIVAQAQESAYIVPAVQHPDAETLIDPSADFLIGYSRKAYDAAHNWEEDVVDLYFDRPVALGRINISSFEDAGEKVKSVVIKAPGLSGSAAYTAIDFENANVTFTPDVAAEGETAALTLDYGSGAALADDGIFGAYLVALPGNALISEIVVTTDKYIYTKTVSKEISFSNTSFKNLKLDLADATKEEAIPENTTWYKASVLEDGIDYIIVSGGYALKNNDGTLDTVEISPVDGIITFDSAVDPTIVWRATAKEIAADDDLIAGHFTLSNGENMFLQRVSAGNHEYEMGVGAIPGTVKYYAWDYDGQYLYHVSNSSATFYCFYNSGWVTDYQNQKEVQIYTSRPPIEMSFSQTDVTFDKEGTDPFVAPTLIKPDSVTEITFSSSNETVATVDADGNVAILKTGTTVITAVAAGNADFQAGFASYTLTVTSSSVHTKIYRKVTSSAELEVGTQYLLVYENDSKVFKPIYDASSNAHFTAEAANALDVVISNGTITSADLEASEMTLESGYHFYVVSEEKYLYPTNSSYNSSCIAAEDTKTDSHAFSLSISSSGVATISRSSNNSTYSLCYSDYFRGSSSVSANVSLYKLDDGRKAQVLGFSPSSVEYDMDSSEPLTKPELSGAQGEVTYSSSNEGIASVDETTGNVTVHKAGTVEITASAAGNTEYKPGSASYTLTITSNNVPKWYLVDEIVGGEYLIVSNGHVLLNNNGSVSSEEVSVNNGVIDYDAPATAIWTAATYGEGYSLINSDKYLRRSSSSLQIGSASSTETYNRWYYNASTQQLTLKGTSSTYYLRYDSSWGISTSSASAALYSTTPPKQAQEISFSETSFTFDMAEEGATFTAPSLSGAQTTVTYTSSKPAVATVDTATGAIEITGVGTTVITASAEGTDAFKPATASYTIHVTDSSTPVTTKRYVLATEIVDGKDYLIVSGGYALKNDGGTAASVAVTPVDGVIEFEPGEDDALVWLAENHGEVMTSNTSSSAVVAGHFSFSNGDYRLNRNSSSGTFSVSFVSTSTVDKYDVWDLQDYNGESYLFHDSSNSMRFWFCYNRDCRLMFFT